MKRRDLLRALSEAAGAAGERFEPVRSGASHDIYRVAGLTVVIPRHKEINELTARRLIKNVQAHLMKEAT